jgi:aryl-alcohol dehydrogenase-like predicted oxidoreductase
MGNGLLTGKIRTVEDVKKPGDLRAALPQLQGENLDANLALVNKIADLAVVKGATTAQVALAWLLAQGDDIFPIPGTSSPTRLAENMGSLSITLTSDEEKAIRGLAQSVKGGRFQDKTGFSFADTPPLQ